MEEVERGSKFPESMEKGGGMIRRGKSSSMPKQSNSKSASSTLEQKGAGNKGLRAKQSKSACIQYMVPT